MPPIDAKRKRAYTVVEPGVICLGKGNYKLPSTLVAGINPYSLICQALGAHERDKLEEKVWLRLK